jgi:TRAP-type mannitol/chloroaromatic compound transport system permease small subunit
LLYAYTAILALFYCGATAREVIVHFNEPYDFPLRLIMLVVFISVKLLTLVGIAEILRRLLPMFDESRTLV